MLVAHNTLVVVADGRKALFLRNEGDADYPNLIVEHAEDRINPADRDQKTDAPGRASGGVGGRQNTMDEVDFHQQEEDRFAADIGAMLKSRARQRVRGADHCRPREDAGRVTQTLSCRSRKQIGRRDREGSHRPSPARNREGAQRGLGNIIPPLQA